MPSVADAVAHVLDGARLPALVVTDLDLGLLEVADVADVAVIRVGEPRPEGQVRTVVLVVADVPSLRRAAERLAGIGWARMVGVVVAGAEAALAPRRHPAWPGLTDVDARLLGDVACTRVTFSARLDAGPVLAGLARAAALPVTGGYGGVRVAAAYDPDAKTPPDVVVADAAAGRLAVSEVIDRPPVLVSADELGPDPLDEAVYHPVGFRRDWERPVVDLPASTRLSPALVRDLRDAQGVRVAPGADQQLAAGLAMSGIPLVGPPHGVPEVDLDGALDDALRREELSVRLRRAAIARHSIAAHRARLAARAGVRRAADPTVSLVVVTRRPERLGHALAQVARQRPAHPAGPGADVELVLAAHGFTPDRAVVRDALGVLPHTIVEATTDSLGGHVLRQATDAASGDVVLTMDDADWYGPDVVTDLLLARRYTGADVVGMPAEMVYLEATDTTVRLRGPSETHDTDVADATVLIDRTVLRDLGTRPVGTGLLDAVRHAGGSIYGTHGLGYLRRGADVDVRPERVAARWPGFRPSALMDLP